MVSRETVNFNMFPTEDGSAAAFSEIRGRYKRIPPPKDKSLATEIQYVSLK
jgi:hypothetical protein